MFGVPPLIPFLPPFRFISQLRVVLSFSDDRQTKEATCDDAIDIRHSYRQQRQQGRSGEAAFKTLTMWESGN